MVLISLLTSALNLPKTTTHTELIALLGITSYKMYKLTPVESLQDADEIVLSTPTNFSLSHIENILTENSQLRLKVEKSHQALLEYSSRLQKLSTELSLTKSQRQKTLETENKKLREEFKKHLEIHTLYKQQAESFLTNPHNPAFPQGSPHPLFAISSDSLPIIKSPPNP